MELLLNGPRSANKTVSNFGGHKVMVILMGFFMLTEHISCRPSPICLLLGIEKQKCVMLATLSSKVHYSSELLNICVRI